VSTACSFFVYHCFDRIVIHSYLSGLSVRTGGLLFPRRVASHRRQNALSSAPAIIGNGSRPSLAINASPSSGRKKVSARGVRQALGRTWSRRPLCVYFIFQSMEQATFRCSVPKFHPGSNHRILSSSAVDIRITTLLRDETGRCAARGLLSFQTTIPQRHSFIDRN